MNLGTNSATGQDAKETCVSETLAPPTLLPSQTVLNWVSCEYQEITTAWIWLPYHLHIGAVTPENTKTQTSCFRCPPFNTEQEWNFGTH